MTKRAVPGLDFSETSTGSTTSTSRGTSSTSSTSRACSSSDLGTSLVQRNQSVNDIIKEHFPTSLKLGCLAMLWAVLIGIPLGVISALKQNTIIDYVTMVFVNLRYALPNFLVCTLLIYWMLSAIIIFANLVVDVLYGFPDPRTRDIRS